MDASTSDLQRMLLDQRPASATFDGIQLGVINTVDGTTCTFTIPTFDDSTFLGPAPLPKGAVAAAGDQCVVGFVGTGADQPYILAVLGAGGGGGTDVTSINDITPDGSGNVALTAADVDADPAGAAAAAQTNAESYTDGKIAAEVTRADGAYDPDGAAAAAQAAAEAASDPAGSAAAAIATALLKANNLSDLASASAARANLGLGGAAVLNVGTASGTVAAGNDSRITGAAQKASNLSDLASAVTARTNLGLGSVALTSYPGSPTGQVLSDNGTFITPSGGTSITTVNGNISTNQTVTTSATVIQTIASLATGTWLITVGALVSLAAGQTCDVWLDVGSATATITGLVAQTAQPGANSDVPLSLRAIVTVTSAGTLKIKGQATASVTVLAATSDTSRAGCTGYVGEKI